MARQKGWDPQRIIASVRMKGSNLQRLGQENGFSRITFNRAVRERFPRAHQLIADFIGVPRQKIWPQFYDEANNLRRFRQVRADQARGFETEARAA